MLTVGFKGLTEKGNREFAAPGEIVTERYTQPDARNELFAAVVHVSAFTFLFCEKVNSLQDLLFLCLGL